MRAVHTLILTTGCVLGLPACVSQKEHEKAQEQIRTLNYKLDVAERNLNVKEQVVSTLRQEKTNAEKELEAFKDRLKNAQGKIKDVRAELEGEYSKRIEELQKELQKDVQKDLPTVEISSYGGIVLESGIFFKPGAHELQQGGKKILDTLIAKFKSEKYLATSIEIAGHTDSDPVKYSKTRYTDNHMLAANRANEVRKYLVQQGVNDLRVYLSAWGSQRPLFPSAPKEKNRRVEIVLHEEDGPTTLPASAPR